VEKYVKALLVLHGVDFPRTHDLEALVGLLPRRIEAPLTLDEQDLLTEYATGARYPGWGDISLADTRKAVRISRRVRKRIRQLLPRTTSRQRRRSR
jgi:HEPN domain-containing protein